MSSTDGVKKAGKLIVTFENSTIQVCMLKID